MNEIICIGEIVWDVFGEESHLGGAPFNVAYHLRQLGENVSMVSRIGRDEAGNRIVGIFRENNLDTSALQIDSRYPTGSVQVSMSGDNAPVYTIVSPAAWDFIESDKTLLQLAEKSRALVFGSLAQREERSRRTIKTLLDLPVTKVFDVNFRPPFIQREIIEYALHRTDILKLNEQELQLLSDWFDLPEEAHTALKQIAAIFHCSTICLTRAERGAVLLREGNIYEHPGFTVKLQDAVGAGDAFLAALLHKLLNGADPRDSLLFANAAGALVASQKGATPKINKDLIHEFIRLQQKKWYFK